MLGGVGGCDPFGQGPAACALGRGVGKSLWSGMLPFARPEGWAVWGGGRSMKHPRLVYINALLFVTMQRCVNFRLVVQYVSFNLFV